MQGTDRAGSATAVDRIVLASYATLGSVHTASATELAFDETAGRDLAVDAWTKLIDLFRPAVWAGACGPCHPGSADQAGADSGPVPGVIGLGRKIPYSAAPPRPPIVVSSTILPAVLNCSCQ